MMKVKDLRAIANALPDDAEVMIRNHHSEDVPVTKVKIDIVKKGKGLNFASYIALRFVEEKL